MLNLIENNKQTLHRLCEKYDIKTMYVFGSATTADFNESSDIDILISFKEILSISTRTITSNFMKN
jgi:uncharacterized protein